MRPRQSLRGRLAGLHWRWCAESRPEEDLFALYRQPVFNALIGNTDDRLKKFPLRHIGTEGGRGHRLDAQALIEHWQGLCRLDYAMFPWSRSNLGAFDRFGLLQTPGATPTRCCN